MKMSQKNVERIIGRLVTDETFRNWFAKNPEEAMETMFEHGVELTSFERQALRSIDLSAAAAFAKAIDPALQKI